MQKTCALSGAEEGFIAWLVVGVLTGIIHFLPSIWYDSVVWVKDESGIDNTLMF